MAATDFVTEAQIDALAAAIATSVNARKSDAGTLASLATTAKSSLVAAINEVQASAGAGGASIADGSTATTTTWSSTKIVDAIAAAVSGLLGGAASAYDTLGEIQTLMASDDTETSGILTALGNRLRFDAAQTLTSPQKAQALANLGVVTSASNFATAYNTSVA